MLRTLVEILRHGLKNRSFVIGGTISLAFFLVAFLSYFWTPYPVEDINIADKLLKPSSQYLLGTDHFGRDILSMLIKGARNSVIVAFVAIGIGIGCGVPLGLTAAAKKGWMDELIMRFNDFTFAFPSLISAIMITAILGPGSVNSIIAIGIFNIPVFARVARGAALSIWKREFILAARSAGKGQFRISVEHILPNISSMLIVQATIQFALGILAEASLSYLGLGTQPPMPSWGKMLNEAQTFLHFAPQLAIYPGIAIALTVMGLNLFGDGLRDVLDPKLRRSR
ncbi:MAG: ABC transporter permease [Desulfobacula sp.]|jgi:peptide/nickel transport system permease protein|uniref:ABC transporter permease n=1 Tax=Desulfobacula sp. TaxID=2593537 RepID=UPI001DA03605|nr:ABC transporter permease [Desulfobacula sp.]MBT3487082.1 ABC transporter permease [Desulfobacula sp.]MBT3805789.1 ABC transporter permease [Desulfobacula sp.]MBT4024771.1 ABC transporter permease [Desulfobacula sp.]MBT4200211.1 ABC transporter permease [Desulfobacula sp.]